MNDIPSMTRCGTVQTLQLC